MLWVLLSYILRMVNACMISANEIYRYFQLWRCFVITYVLSQLMIIIFFTSSVDWLPRFMESFGFSRIIIEVFLARVQWILFSSCYWGCGNCFKTNMELRRSQFASLLEFCDFQRSKSDSFIRQSFCGLVFCADLEFSFLFGFNWCL